jgi:hypothetical protein
VGAVSGLPAFPIEGGCACGAVRYRLSAPPLVVYSCHCTDCQTLTTSVFSLNGIVGAEALELTKGALRTWIRTADSGAQIPQHVCAHCGVRIYTEAPQARGTKTLRLGTLDDAGWVRPAAGIWMKSALPWVALPEGALRYDAQPDSFGPIIGRWREMMGLESA